MLPGKWQAVYEYAGSVPELCAVLHRKNMTLPKKSVIIRYRKEEISL